MSLLELPPIEPKAGAGAIFRRCRKSSRGSPAEPFRKALPWIDCALEGPRLVFVDGKLAADRSNPGTIEMGSVEAGPADHALARLVGPEGWKLKLGRDHAPQGLVQIVHISTGGADHLPAEIELDVDAQASVVETYIGGGWINRLTRITLFRGARLMLSRRLLGDSGTADM